MSSKCVQTSNLPLLDRALFFNIFCFLNRADMPLAALLPLLTFSSGRLDSRPSWPCLWALFWVHRARFPCDLDWLLKVKALSTASFLSISHPRPPDTWHYDTAASSLKLQHLCQSLYSEAPWAFTLILQAAAYYVCHAVKIYFGIHFSFTFSDRYVQLLINIVTFKKVTLAKISNSASSWNLKFFSYLH